MKNIEKRLDDLIRKITRKRDSSCIVCGSPNNLENGHFKSRRHKQTRWELDNNHLICVTCNRTDETANNKIFEQNLINKIGLERVERLHILAVSSDRFYACDLEDIEKNLKNFYKTL